MREERKLTAIEYLNQFQFCEAQIQNLQEEIEKLEYKASGLSAKGINISKSGTINNKSPQEKTITKIIEFEKKLEEKQNEYYELKLEIIILLEKMSNYPDQANVLYKKYVMGYSWNKIADNMFITPRTAQRTHYKAIKRFEKILESCRTLSHSDVLI